MPDYTNHERVSQLLRAVTSVVWFRRDLRLDDNPALTAALAEDGEVVPLFVRDPGLAGDIADPSRRMDRLDATLVDLDDRLRSVGGRLIIRTGRPEEVVPAVAARSGREAGPCRPRRHAVCDTAR